MDLYGQYNKLTKEQKSELCHLAWLAITLKNGKLWRKYWATKRNYLILQNMKKLSANSKQGQHYVEAYDKSTWHTLKDVYGKPSAAKQAAFKRCLQKCEEENGDRFRIISAGAQFFTIAFEVRNMFGANELRVITPSQDYLIIFGSTL